MNTPQPPALSNSDELTRRLLAIPFHRRWTLEVVLTALSVVNRRAPWMAPVIKPIAPIVGAVLRFVADTVFEVTQHIHIREHHA
jgi:hypothetical protein